MLESFEKVPVKIYPTPTEGSNALAAEIAKLIREKQTQNLPCVLGMATGATPILLYKELVRMHKEEGLSFKNVITKHQFLFLICLTYSISLPTFSSI